MSKPLSKAARYIIAGYAVCAATVAFAIEPALTVVLLLVVWLAGGFGRARRWLAGSGAKGGARS